MNGSALLERQSVAILSNLAKSSQITEEETEQNLSPKLLTGRVGCGAQVSYSGTLHPRTLVISLKIYKCHMELGALASNTFAI